MNWVMLDERHLDVADPKVARKLIRKNAVSTWGIDLRVFDRIKEGHEGFNAFRITQVDSNSGGTFNLCLGGIEIYGAPVICEDWDF